MDEPIRVMETLESYKVPSQSDPDIEYDVDKVLGEFQGLEAMYWICSCPHFQNKLKFHASECKHIKEVKSLEEVKND